MCWQVNQARIRPWQANNAQAYSDRVIGVEGGAVAREIRHYSKKVRRQITNETRTRHILVVERTDGVCLIFYEVRRTRDRDDSTTFHDLHPILRKSYLRP